jgi:hemerythrin-like domain-containing protein
MVDGNRKRAVGAKALFQRMRRDHARVLARIGALEAALRRRGCTGTEQASALDELLDLLGAQFASHMTAEDEALYPAILAALPAASGSIESLLAEHAELRQMLRRLRELNNEPASSDRSEQIRVQVHDVSDLLRLHIEKEESLIFRLAPRLLAPDEIAAVAAHFSLLETRHTTGRPPTTSKGVSP